MDGDVREGLKSCVPSDLLPTASYSIYPFAGLVN